LSGFEEGLGKENARQGISVEVVGGRFLFCFAGWLPSLSLGNAAIFVVHLFGEQLGRRALLLRSFRRHWG
jgi:TctA family transporter